MVRFLYCWQRNLCHYQGPASRPAEDLEGTAKQGRPLLHAGEPYSLAPNASIQHLGKVEAEPPILNSKAYGSSRVLEDDVRPLALGVLAHVCQRFLGNPKQSNL